LQDGATMATQPTDTTKPRLRTLSDELGVIAQRAQAFTNASGTAIALNEGNADEIVCRARSGSAAPEVGAVLRVEGSFTGLCIQTGMNSAVMMPKLTPGWTRPPSERWGSAPWWSLPFAMTTK